MLLAREGSQGKLLSAFGQAQRQFEAGRKMPTDLGITGSTFRAYRNCGGSPSATFRSWATGEAYALINRRAVQNRKDFLKLHGELASSLSAHWSRTGLRNLTVAEKYKIVDLFVKAVAFTSAHPSEKEREALYHYGNIPLDKFSLIAIDSLFYGIVVNPTPSMGHIRDEQTYGFLQDQIYRLTQATNIPNLVFDHYAWNLTH